MKKKQKNQNNKNSPIINKARIKKKQAWWDEQCKQAREERKKP